MPDVNVTMDNVKNVGVEFERESGNLWLYFEEGKSQLLTIVTPEVWEALTTAVDKARSPACPGHEYSLDLDAGGVHFRTFHCDGECLAN